MIINRIKITRLIKITIFNVNNNVERFFRMFITWNFLFLSNNRRLCSASTLENIHWKVSNDRVSSDHYELWTLWFLRSGEAECQVTGGSHRTYNLIKTDGRETSINEYSKYNPENGVNYSDVARGWVMMTLGHYRMATFSRGLLTTSEATNS